jgi:hypothetical protein
VRPNATANQIRKATVVAAQDGIINLLSKTQTVQLYAASARAPKIIDRPSTAAKGAPFCDKVIRIVASATEGAAPNRPAKLFGRTASPKAANAETAIPPILNLKIYSSKSPRPFKVF